MEKNILIAIFILFALFSLLSDPFWSAFFSLVFIYIACSEMWSFMISKVNLLSLGQQAFIGLGGYTLAVSSVYYDLPIPFGILMSACVAGIFTLLELPPLLRLRGIYFAVGSWLFSEIIHLIFINWEFVHAGRGMAVPKAYGMSPTITYFMALCVAIISVSVIYFLSKSKTGLALRSIGENEMTALSIGINSFKYRGFCFFIASLITGLAGGVYYTMRPYVIPWEAFGIQWTIGFAFASIIGGSGTLLGPVIGSIIHVSLIHALAGFTIIAPLIDVIVVIIVLFVFPKGIWGTIAEKMRFKLT